MHKDNVRVRTAKAVPLKKDPEKTRYIVTNNNNRSQSPQPPPNASIFGSLRRGQSGVATSTPKSTPTTATTNDVRKAKVSVQPRTRPPDKDKKPWFRPVNNNAPKKDPIKSSNASLSVNSVQKSTIAADSKRKRPISNTLSTNVTLRRGQNQKIEGQNVPDNLSRTSSITNLDVEQKGNKGAKPRKAASRDRIDKIGDHKKNEKKGVTKNNNKLESNDSPYPSIDSLQEEEFVLLRKQLQEMAQEKTNLALQLGEQKGQLNMLQKEIQNLKEESNIQLEHLTEENTALRNRLRDVAHSPLSDNEKQQLLYETHRHHSSAPASIATNLTDEGNGGDITACPTPDWDKHSTSNISDVSVACLQDKINQMQETHYSTNEELQATLQELTDLQRQLTELQQENERLNEEKTLMFDSLCRQTERLNDSRSEVESLKQLLYREKDETGQYESAVEREQKLIVLLKSAQEEREGLLSKLDQMNNDLQETRAAHAEKEERITHLSERVRTLECTLDAKHAEHKQLDQELAQARDQCSGKQIEINRLTDLLDNARTKISELEQDRALSDKSELDELLDNARKEKDALESEVAHLKEQLAISKNETEKLKEQVSILQEECKVTRNNAKTTQCDLEYKCERLVLEKNSLNSQLQEFQDAINELQVQSQCQLEDKRQLSAVLSETQRNLSEAERKNLTLENEVLELKRLRDEENEEWEKFQNDLLTSVRVANDFKTEAQQELQRMIMENKSYRERERQLKAELDKLKGDNTKKGVSTTNSSSRSKLSDKENVPIKEMDGLFKLQKRNKDRSTRGSKESLDVIADRSKGKKPEPVKTVKKRDRPRTSVRKRKTLSVEEEMLLKSLDDWYEHIDKNVPEENLTEEDKVIKKLKTLYENDSLKARPVAPKPKDQLAISKPLLDSVFLNPKLEKIAKNPDILTIEDMRSSAIINSENEIPELRNSPERIMRPANIKSEILDGIEPKRISIIGRSKSYDDLNQFKAEKEDPILYRCKETHDLSRETPLKRFTTQSTILPGDSVSNPRYSNFAIVANQEATEREPEDNHMSRKSSVDFKTLDKILAFIPENVPEHELPNEQQLALRLKRALDEAERKNTLKKMQKNKNIYISPPTIESVQKNSRLRHILLDPDIESVQKRKSDTRNENIAPARTDALRESISCQDISFIFQLDPNKTEKCVVVEDNYCTLEVNVSLTKDAEVNVSKDLTKPVDEPKSFEDHVTNPSKVEYDSLEYNETLQKRQKCGKKTRVSKYREHIFDNEPLVQYLDDDLHYATFENNDLFYNETLMKRLQLDQLLCDQEEPRNIVRAEDEPQFPLQKKEIAVEDEYFDYRRFQVARSFDLGVIEQSRSIVFHTDIESPEDDVLEDKVVPKLAGSKLPKVKESMDNEEPSIAMEYEINKPDKLPKDNESRVIEEPDVSLEYRSKKPEPLKRNKFAPNDDITAAKALESLLLEKPVMKHNRKSLPLEMVKSIGKRDKTAWEDVDMRKGLAIEDIDQSVLVSGHSTDDARSRMIDLNNKSKIEAVNEATLHTEGEYIDNSSNRTDGEKGELLEQNNKEVEEFRGLDVFDEFEKRISYLRGNGILSPSGITEIASEDINSISDYSDYADNQEVDDLIADMETSTVDYISEDKPDTCVNIGINEDDHLHSLTDEPSSIHLGTANNISGLKHYENVTLNTVDDEVKEDLGEYDYHSILKENRYGVVSPLNIRLTYKDVVKEFKCKFPEDERISVIEDVTEADLGEQDNSFFDDFFGVKRKGSVTKDKTETQVSTNVDDIDKEMEEIFEKYLHTPLSKVITQIEEKDNNKVDKVEQDLNVNKKTEEDIKEVLDLVDATLENAHISTGNTIQDFIEAEVKDDNVMKNEGQTLEKIELIMDDGPGNLVDEIVTEEPGSYINQKVEMENNLSESCTTKKLVDRNCKSSKVKELVLTGSITSEPLVPDIIESINRHVSYNTLDEDLVEAKILITDHVEEHLTPEELNLIRSAQNVRYSRPLSDFNEADLQKIQEISLNYIPEKHENETEAGENRKETLDGADENEVKVEIANSIIILEPNDTIDYVTESEERGSKEKVASDEQIIRSSAPEENYQKLNQEIYLNYIPEKYENEAVGSQKETLDRTDENEVKVEILNSIIVLEPNDTIDYVTESELIKTGLRTGMQGSKEMVTSDDKTISSTTPEEDRQKLNQGPDLYAILAKYLPPKLIPPQEDIGADKHEELAEFKQQKPKIKLRHKPFIHKDDFERSLLPPSSTLTLIKGNEDFKNRVVTQERSKTVLNADGSKVISASNMSAATGDMVVRGRGQVTNFAAVMALKPKDLTSHVSASESEDVVKHKTQMLDLQQCVQQHVNIRRRNIAPVCSHEEKDSREESADVILVENKEHDEKTDNKEQKIVMKVEDPSKYQNETKKLDVLPCNQDKEHELYYVDVTYDLAKVVELRQPIEVSFVGHDISERNEQFLLEESKVEEHKYFVKPPVKEIDIQHNIEVQKNRLLESVESNDNHNVAYHAKIIGDGDSVAETIINSHNKEESVIRRKDRGANDFERILARITASRSSASINGRNSRTGDIKTRISGFAREEKPNVKKPNPIDPNIYLRKTGYEGVKSKLDYFSRTVEGPSGKRQSHNVPSNRSEPDRRRVKSCAEIFENRTLDSPTDEPIYANIRAISPSISSKPLPAKAEKKPLPVPRSRNPSGQVPLENSDAVKIVQNDESLTDPNMSECKIISENDAENLPQEVPNSEFPSVGGLDIPLYYATSKIVIDRPKQHEPEKNELDRHKSREMQKAALGNTDSAGLDKSEKFLDRMRGMNENLASGAENSHSSIAVAGKFEQLDITKHNDDVEEIDINNDSNLNLFHLETSSYDESYLSLFKSPEDKIYDDISGIKRPQKGYFNIAYLGEVSDNESYEEFGKAKPERNKTLEESDSKPKIIDFVPLDDATKPVFKNNNLSEPNYDTLEREKTFHVLNSAGTTAKVKKGTTGLEGSSSKSSSRTSFSAAKKVFEALLEANMDKKTDDKSKQ